MNINIGGPQKLVVIGPMRGIENLKKVMDEGDWEEIRNLSERSLLGPAEDDYNNYEMLIFGNGLNSLQILEKLIRDTTVAEILLL